MLSYTTRRNLFGSLANNTATATLTLADGLMNNAEKRIISAKDWPFLWKQYTMTTTASTQAYTLPPYTQKPQSVYVTVGSYRYAPEEVTTRTEWDKLNEVSVSSDIPTYYFVYDGQLLLFPTPSTSSNTITFNGRKYGKDLTLADYTTGTIVTATNASAAIVGSGTSWTSAMAGRFLQITDSNTANKGDGYWYEILSVTDTTHLTLVKTYGGTSIAAGAAVYTIAQCSLIPEPHAELPVFEALNIYYTSVNPKPNQATLYANKFKEGYAQMFKDYISKASVVLDDGDDDTPINPNLLIHL